MDNCFRYTLTTETFGMAVPTRKEFREAGYMALTFGFSAKENINDDRGSYILTQGVIAANNGFDFREIEIDEPPTDVGSYALTTGVIAGTNGFDFRNIIIDEPPTDNGYYQLTQGVEAQANGFDFREIDFGEHNDQGNYILTVGIEATTNGL